MLPVNTEPFILYECENGYYIADTHDRLLDVEYELSRSELKFLAQDMVVFVKPDGWKGKILTHTLVINNIYSNNEEELRRLRKALGEELDITYDAYHLSSHMKTNLSPSEFERVIRHQLSTVDLAIDVYIAYLRFSLEHLEDEDAKHQKTVLQELIEDDEYTQEDVDNAEQVLVSSLVSHFTR